MTEEETVMTTVTSPTATTVLPQTLRHHLASWAGAVPPGPRVQVVAHQPNAEPGWDLRPQLVTGLVDPTGRVVVAVPPDTASIATQLLSGCRDIDLSAGLQLLPGLVGKPEHALERVAFRWTERPADLPNAGIWVDTENPCVPDWPRPFGGQVLVALDEHGDYLAGVGIKRHDSFGHEISVGTEPRARGRGLARCLVAQAARHILDSGRIPTYLHTLDNVASARVAAAVGFDDTGWSALMLSEHPVSIAA
jgi:GNAT superfamily N-acetyltransferase